MSAIGKNYSAYNSSLFAGANLEQVKQNVSQLNFKNKKAQQKTIQKSIKAFSKADADKNGILSQDEIKLYDKKEKQRKTIAISAAIIGAITIAAGITYAIKSGKLAKIWDDITQNNMAKKLKENYGNDTIITKGEKGALFIASDAAPVPEWKVDGKSDFDKFIKRYGLSAIDENGKKIPYTMASRGTIEASGDVTMTIPKYKDKYGRLWTMIQEEARPIDVARRGKEARILAFPAGCIGDEFLTETAKDTALRELAEETGMMAKKIKSLNPSAIKNGKSIEIPTMTSPGLTDESTYFYEAIVDNFKPSTKATTDGGVTRGWHFVPLDKISEWLESMSKKGKMPSGQSLTGLQLLKKQ